MASFVISRLPPSCWVSPMAELNRLMIEKAALEALSDRVQYLVLGGGKILNESNISTNTNSR